MEQVKFGPQLLSLKDAFSNQYNMYVSFTKGLPLPAIDQAFQDINTLGKTDQEIIDLINNVILPLHYQHSTALFSDVHPNIYEELCKAVDKQILSSMNQNLVASNKTITNPGSGYSLVKNWKNPFLDKEGEPIWNKSVNYGLPGLSKAEEDLNDIKQAMMIKLDSATGIPPYYLGMDVQTKTELKEEVETQETTVHKPALQSLTEEEALIDEYIVLQQKYEELEIDAHIKRMNELKKKLQVLANAEEDNCIAILKSPRGEIEFSPVKESVEISKPLELMDKLHEKIGTDALEQCVKISITGVRKLLSKEELEPFLEIKKGNRTIKEVRFGKV